MLIRKQAYNFVGYIFSQRFKREKLQNLNRISRYVENDPLNINSACNLTKKEISLIKSTFGRESREYEPWLRFYKTATGIFNPEFIPCWQYAYMELSLNKRRYEGFAQHKCNLRYFIGEENRPTTILYAMDGVLYDRTDKIITPSMAIKKLGDYDEMVFKVASSTGGGKDVKKITMTEKSDVDFIASKINKIDQDFIVQEIIKQDSTLAALNDGGGCNTLRVLTININNKCSVLSMFLKIGAKGSFTDNVCGGGMLCGVDILGNVKEVGYTHDYTRTYTTPAGLPLGGLKISHIDEVVRFVTEAHKSFQQMHLIGWDIAISQDGRPVVIEINLDSAEILAHQIPNGPVLGSRYDEVMEYLSQNTPTKFIKIKLKQ